MNERSTVVVPKGDRPLILYELLERISALRAERGDRAEVEQLTAEFQQLRSEL